MARDATGRGGREGGSASGMQDTVKLPAESPIPGGVGWTAERTLSTLRPPGTAVQAGICLVSLFMRSNIVIWHRTGGVLSVPCGRR